MQHARADSAGRRIRVVHLVEGPQTTGAPTSIRHLLASLDRQRFEPIPVAAMDGAFVKVLEGDGHEVRVLDLVLGRVLNETATRGRRNPLKWMRVCHQLRKDARRLREFLRDERIDIVHSHHHHHHLLNAMASRRDIPSVWHIRAITNPRSLGGIAPAMLGFCANRYASRLIAISNAVAASLPSAARGKTKVIYNGIDLRRYSGATPADGKRKLGFAEDAVLVGAVGRFAPEKGFLGFIEAAGLLSQSYEQAQFLLIGPCAEWLPQEVQYHRRCVARIAELGLTDRFHLTGRLDNPWEFMAGLDVLVLPTVAREGLGNVVLEAHAGGVPVVSTACGGPADVIVEGQTGFIVPCGDAAAMADRLLSLLSDPERMRRMGAAARRRVEEPRFDLAFTVKQVEEVYLSLVG